MLLLLLLLLPPPSLLQMRRRSTLGPVFTLAWASPAEPLDRSRSSLSRLILSLFIGAAAESLLAGAGLAVELFVAGAVYTLPRSHTFRQSP